ncbi:EVE domain-containing protein [Nostoc sp.]|uniref:EVE domain-containing protein n=1 Tax=Nostoc sp. TaxID=1180 RepID=UPI002FFBE7DA
MAYWLLKTEPENYSYFDLEREGSTVWDGVNNSLALKHLRTMLLGDGHFAQRREPPHASVLDLALIYHTGKERQVIGLAQIVSQPYIDPALNDSKRAVVDVRALRRLHQPVTLAQIKQDNKFTDFDLLRLPRLSVVPVGEVYWQCLIELTNGTN